MKQYVRKSSQSAVCLATSTGKSTTVAPKCFLISNDSVSAIPFKSLGVSAMLRRRPLTIACDPDPRARTMVMLWVMLWIIHPSSTSCARAELTKLKRSTHISTVELIHRLSNNYSHLPTQHTRYARQSHLLPLGIPGNRTIIPSLLCDCTSNVLLFFSKDQQRQTCCNRFLGNMVWPLQGDLAHLRETIESRHFHRSRILQGRCR